MRETVREKEGEKREREILNHIVWIANDKTEYSQREEEDAPDRERDEQN